MMCFSAAELATFFTAEDQMGMPALTRTRLCDEGITTPKDLDEFDEDSIKEIAETSRKPGDRIWRSCAQGPSRFDDAMSTLHLWHQDQEMLTDGLSCGALPQDDRT